MQINVMLAESGHLEQCERVFLDSPLYRNYFAEEGRMEEVLGAAIAKEQLYMGLSAGGEVVAAMQIDPAGFMGICPYLALLGVRKDWRGKGVGHRMLQVYEELCRALGHTKATMMVSHVNPRAKKLYQSLGYKKVGYVENIIKPGIHENIMIKYLK